MAKRVITPNKETFQIIEPEAQKVLLVGDFTDWQQRPIAMQKQEGGVWTSAVNLPVGTHYYLFIVDGRWCEDPECTMRVPNPFGGQNMVRQVA